MEKVIFQNNGTDKSFFLLQDEGKKMGEMEIGLDGKRLIVYHTEIKPEYEGNGLSKLLLDAMTDYARKNELQVVPLCAYVHVQFKRHPQDYADIWSKEPAV